MNFLSSENKISELCNENQGCINKNCDNNHPRGLVGVCIAHLQKICNDQNLCGLQHFTLQMLKKNLQILPINGIYQINLCKKQGCKDANCQYLHPLWHSMLCWKCLNFEDCNNHSDEGHDWDWLRVQVYQKYNKQECNPENLCSCTAVCGKKGHTLALDQYCIQYFQGICPFLVCVKQHVFWEEYKIGALPQNIQDQVLKPCIAKNESQQFDKQNQTYTHNIFQKQEELKYYQMRVLEQPIIDIIFILDITYSMQPWIDTAKNSICAITREFKQKNSLASVRLAIVCYRDFCDKPIHIFSHNFTTRSEQIEQFLQKMNAAGGEDLPEDLIGALEVAYRLNISTHENSMLNLYIITDAPCHGGKRYHSLMIDEYLDQEGKLEAILTKFKELKNKFFVTFFQLSKDTLIMEKIMKDLLVSSFFTAKVNLDQFESYVKFSLGKTFKKPQPLPFETRNCELIKAKYEKQRQMPFNYDRRNKQSSYTNYFNKQLDAKHIISEADLEIEYEEINLSNYEKGAVSTIFKAFDSKNNRYVVLKLPQSVVSKYNLGKLTVNLVQEAESNAKLKYRQQLIAQQLAAEFNQQILQNNLQSQIFPIFYTSPLLYTLDKPFFGLTVIYGETFIDIKNKKWKKYSNNYDQAETQNNLIAFSHFSYEVTNHELIITDLQGKINILSDPAIHTMDESEAFKCDTNYYSKGIQAYFSCQHKMCNKVCQKLGLQSSPFQEIFYQQLPSQQISGQQSIQSQSEEATKGSCSVASVYYQEEKDQDLFLFLICSNCGRLEELKDRTIDLCTLCDFENKKDSKQVQCECCNQYYLQKYDYELLQATVKERCEECQTQLCFSSNQVCFYCKHKVCRQFKHIMNINQTPTVLCPDAIKYLQSLKCLKCSKYYQFQILLSEESYSQGVFQCCK